MTAEWVMRDSRKPATRSRRSKAVLDTLLSLRGRSGSLSFGVCATIAAMSYTRRGTRMIGVVIKLYLVDGLQVKNPRQ